MQRVSAAAGAAAASPPFVQQQQQQQQQPRRRIGRINNTKRNFGKTNGLIVSVIFVSCTCIFIFILSSIVSTTYFTRPTIKSEENEKVLLRGKDPTKLSKEALINEREKARSLFVNNFNDRNGKQSKTKLPPYPYPLTVVDETYDISTEFVPAGGKRYTEYTTGLSPYHITAEIQHTSDIVARSRRFHIKKAMEHAWDGYVEFAFGMDEVLPISGRGHDAWGGQGVTLIDSLDTLWIMDMKDQFERARDWVRDHLDHSKVTEMVSVFETTIRDLGGLLSAYDLSGDPVFLDKAIDLGERLFKAFATPSGIPFGQISPRDGAGAFAGWTGGNAILSEFTTLQVEFRYLAKVSGRTDFATKVEHVFEIMNEIAPENGLYPNFYSATDNVPSPGNDKITFGAMSDSFYEYMLKVWLQGGRTEPMYRQMYDKAIDGMHKVLLKNSTPSGLVYIADLNWGNYDHKMDHLVCFMGGLLALGAYTDPLGMDSPRAIRDFQTAKALTYTCYQTYARMPTGIGPEYVQFQDGNDFYPGAAHYLLRPETVESLYILNALTGDPIYREWGWEIFQAIEKYCKTEFAYGSINDVQNIHVTPDDKMESFFLAETLKYLYLLQDPDNEIDILEKHVFNTEAHPLRIFPKLNVATK